MKKSITAITVIASLYASMANAGLYIDQSQNDIPVRQINAVEARKNAQVTVHNNSVKVTPVNIERPLTSNVVRNEPPSQVTVPKVIHKEEKNNVVNPANGFGSDLLIQRKGQSNPIVQTNPVVKKENKYTGGKEPYEGGKEPYKAQNETGKEPLNTTPSTISNSKNIVEKHFDQKDVEKNGPQERQIKSPSNSHPITPLVKNNMAYMEKGFLSNSMREQLDSMGWKLQWSSGSDREIDVPYKIEYKNIEDYVTQISGLYGIFIDVYPVNKTIHVQD